MRTYARWIQVTDLMANQNYDTRKYWPAVQFLKWYRQGTNPAGLYLKKFRQGGKYPCCPAGLHLENFRQGAQTRTIT
jgi:hypothetical protein